MIPGLPACLLLIVLTIIPASAQDVQRVAYEFSTDALEASELQAARGRIDRTAKALDLNLAARGASLAGAVLRVLSSRSNVDLDYSPAEEVHAYLRHPNETPSSESVLFRKAGKLYEQATSIRGEGYTFEVDWMNLEARVRIRLP